MTPDRWSQIAGILDLALQAEPGQRAATLDRACEGDPELRREVDAFLQYEDAAGQAFQVTGWEQELAEQPAVAALPDPQRLGPYRIIRRIGEGGMGIVYLAERDDGEYRQQVAIKVMKAGPQGDAMHRMFRNERQILARLEHPNIARLLDGGSTADGRLYYVMEYVDGAPVSRYCEARKLSLRERLELFCQICGAVIHAHRNLVIHRDLKPGNILVTAAGVPKLLDFGLAKVFRESPAADMTASVLPAMTPGYASPEQVRGGHLTTATDVYSLGVVLYELAVGQPPFPAHERTPFAVYRAICEDEPAPPSRTAAGALQRQLRGDLDAIVMKALRKEPESRYGSVEELRQDVRAHLEGFPVQASRGTVAYRVRKFLRRHRWGAAASLAATAGVLAASTTIWWQGRQSEERFQLARGLAHSVVFELHDAIVNLPGSTAARQLLVQRALEYLRKLETTGGKNRDLQLEIAAAYRKIADVQMSRDVGSTGDLAGGRDSLMRAERILNSLLGSGPADGRVEERMAELQGRLADVSAGLGDRPGFRQHAQEQLRLWRLLAERYPGRTQYRANILWSESSLHLRGSEATSRQQALVAAFEEVLKQRPDDRVVQRRLARANARLADTYKEAGDLPAALRHFQAALRLDELRLQRAPMDTQAKVELAYDISDAGWILHRMGNSAAAVEREERAVALLQEVADADRQDRRAQVSAAQTRMTASYAYEGHRDYPRAIAAAARALADFEEVIAVNPEDDVTRENAAGACAQLATLYGKTGSPQSCEYLTRAISHLRRLKNQDPARIEKLEKAQASCR